MSYFIKKQTSGQAEQNNLVIAKYYCGVDLFIGDCVCAASSVDSMRAVQKADPSDLSKMPSIGIVIEKCSSSQYLVQSSGIIENGYDEFVIGKSVFVGHDGRATQIPPVVFEDYVFIQVIGTYIGEGSVLLFPQLGMTKIIK